MFSRPFLAGRLRLSVDKGGVSSYLGTLFLTADGVGICSIQVDESPNNNLIIT